MNDLYTADLKFESRDFTQTRLPKGEYENCIFEECDFSGGFLDNTHFLACTFKDCNLSNANLAHAMFKEVLFIRCKMVGLHFEKCNDFLLSFQFQDCSLQLTSFYHLKIKGTQFSNCNLQEADFAEADLSDVLFDNCNLSRAIFNATILEKADFKTAYGYDIDPEKNRLKKARFSKDGLTGLLKKYDIVIG